MSKAIVIQKNGVDQQNSVDRLSTPKVGGGRELWLPEDVIITGSATVDTNGIVNASDAGLYGFHEANIDVKCVTGEKGGKTYKVTVDEDGYLEYTEVIPIGDPVRIEVIEPPTNPYGIYQNGQTIEKAGMVVKAYDENGNEWGIVPINDITINPTTAVYDAATDYGTATSDLRDTYPQPIPMTYGPIQIYASSDQSPTYVYNYNAPVLKTCIYYQASRWIQYTVCMVSDTPRSSSWSEYTYDGKTVYYYTITFPGYGLIAGPGQSVSSSVNYADDKTAWTMLYGEISQFGSHQEITVSWPRPNDGQVLTTTMTVLVAPGYYDENEA